MPIVKASAIQSTAVALIPLSMNIIPARAATYGNCISDIILSISLEHFTISGLRSEMANLAIKIHKNIMPRPAETKRMIGCPIAPIAMNGIVANAAVDKASEYESSFDIIFMVYEL